ncbi:MAG: NAD(+) synthase [Methanobrevibacter sp.]|jgi:NAD+ synthase|nr:NAD(+) synthase [Candidatus Methanoflexus mossambicus]
MFEITEKDSIFVKNKLMDFIKNIVEKSNSNGVIIGLSGGIDSSVVGYLLTESLGKDKVFGYHLASSTTPKEDTEDARLMAKLLDIEYYEIFIDEIVDKYLEVFDIDNLILDENNSKMDKYGSKNEKYEKLMEYKKLSDGNLKARIRMSILYYFGNLKNSLVAGTGNRSELLIGYFTKYGDGGCDFELIGDIYKTQLKKLAKYWNIPEQIIYKPPRAALWDKQTDEDEIGFSYEVLDLLLHLIVDKKLKNVEIVDFINNSLDFDVKISIEQIIELRNKIKNNEHKIESPKSPFNGIILI